MSVTVYYTKQVSCPFSRCFVTCLVSIAAHYEKKIRGIIEIIVVGDKTMKMLNNQRRGSNRVTDVLSFSWQEDPLPGVVDEKYLGQIYLCYPQIKRQAREFAVSATEEGTRMLVHGLLHLAGYDHVTPQESRKMFARQEKLVAYRDKIK